ncbi:thermoresistant gluconokinase [Pilobolus umbonatus]|nr:thermoresistant gluconokinase [Pilobolus umbonatus]
MSCNVFIVMGVAGCGKSTVALELCKQLNSLFIEGDSLHPSNNINKMASGIPLEDEDRWIWLAHIRERILSVITENKVIVVTCSALKRSYRDILTEIPNVVFVYLKGSEQLLLERLESRLSHFMKPNMLQSQLDVLEEPNEENEKVIVSDINQPAITQATSIIRSAINRGYLS